MSLPSEIILTTQKKVHKNIYSCSMLLRSELELKKKATQEYIFSQSVVVLI